MTEAKGFTLIEILVALIIGVLIVGSVMALNGISLRNQRRIERLQDSLPILDAAAQKILQNPKIALEGAITLKELPNSPTVTVETFNQSDKYSFPSLTYGNLYRVKLRYERDIIEFSIIIPEK